MSKHIPEPWTPVEFKLNANYAEASVWGRTYVWDGTLLPSSIRTADRDLLTKPASLHALFGGIEEPFTKISYTPISCAPDKAVFTVGATAGNILVNIRYTIDYDGYVEMALSVIPFWSYSADNGKLPRLDGLWFEFPLPGANSNLFHFWPNGESGIIPDPNIMSSGEVPAGGITVPFKPYFWTGWEFGGIGIATETDENIQLVPGKPCISLDETCDGRILRWNLLGKMPRQWAGRVDMWTDALEPIDYIFGIQATPVKPLRENRLGLHLLHTSIGAEDKFLIPDGEGKNQFDRMAEAGVNCIIFHEDWSAMQNYGQAVDEARFQAYVESCHARGIKVLAYFGYEYATNAPEWHEKKHDYLIRTPRGGLVGGWQRQNPCQRDYMVCYAGGYAEKMRERVKFAMEHYHLDGIYTDGTYEPWECANAHHGCGYTDENGVRHTTFPVFALRRHVRALYEQVHELGGFIDTHQSSCLLAPTLGYADFFYNGESIQKKLAEDFLGFLNLAAFRTEYMGKNIGLHPQMLVYVGAGISMEKGA